jgi:osmotically-inducible protein OsmY
MTWTYPDERYYYSWYNVPLPTPPSDFEVKQALVARLGLNPYTKDEDIKVDVTDNVAILEGEVSSNVAKRAAGDDAWDTLGVNDVRNELRVKASTAT